MLSRSLTPFSWGGHDCTLFAADCVLALTGTDPAAAYRDNYSSEAGAVAIIAAAGSLRALVTAAMGMEINPKLAQRGDVVLIEAAGKEALGICVGVNLVAATTVGYRSLPMKRAVAAWRVN